jgi:hypothetical protein
LNIGHVHYARADINTRATTWNVLWIILGSSIPVLECGPGLLQWQNIWQC